MVLFFVVFVSWDWVGTGLLGRCDCLIWWLVSLLYLRRKLCYRCTAGATEMFSLISSASHCRSANPVRDPCCLFITFTAVLLYCSLFHISLTTYGGRIRYCLTALDGTTPDVAQRDVMASSRRSDKTPSMEVYQAHSEFGKRAFLILTSLA